MRLTPDQLATAAAIMHALTWGREDAHDEYDPYMAYVERVDEYVHVRFIGTSATRVEGDALDCWIEDMGEPVDFDEDGEKTSLALLWGPISTDTGQRLRAALMRVE